MIRFCHPRRRRPRSSCRCHASSTSAAMCGRDMSSIYGTDGDRPPRRTGGRSRCGPCGPPVLRPSAAGGGRWWYGRNRTGTPGGGVAAGGRPQLVEDPEGVAVAHPVAVGGGAQVGAEGSVAQTALTAVGALEEADDEGREGRDHDDDTDGVGDAGKEFSGYGSNHALIEFPPLVADRPPLANFLPNVPSS